MVVAHRLRSRSGVCFTYLTAFTSGSLVLALEVSGPRLLQSYYGNGLYVWSATISVTLLALSVGYFWGGRLADRAGRRASPAWPLVVGGVVTVAIAVLRTPVLWLLRDCDLRLGILIGTFVLFFPSLVLFGMVAPLLVRRAAGGPERVGRAVGGVFGWSTMGSVAGALGAGFWLIEWLRIDTLVVLIGASASGLGLLWFVARRRAAGGVGAGLGAAAIAGLLLVSPPIEGPWSSTRHCVIHLRNSFYGEIRVVDVKPAGPRDACGRMLLVNGREQAFLTPDFEHSWYSYPIDIQLMRAFRPAGTRVLLVGLGSGGLARTLRDTGLDVDVVEIDPAIVEVARGYFGFADREAGLRPIDVHVADGRYFIEHAAERYDFVVFNAFHGDALPAHFYTRESLRGVRRVLRPGGVLAAAFFGELTGPSARASRAIHATLAACFGSVRGFSHHAGPGAAEAYLYASDAPLVANWRGVTGRLPPDRIDRLRDLEMTGEVAYGSIPGRVLSDAFNPLDLWLGGSTVAWHRNLHENFGAGLLLGDAR